MLKPLRGVGHSNTKTKNKRTKKIQRDFLIPFFTSKIAKEF